MRFFRKYQKILFISTSFAVVVSFVFYGAVSSFTSQPKTVKDPEIAKIIDGSSLRQNKIIKMVRFLSSSSLDTKMKNNGYLPNLLNDGVIEKDFVESGFGKKLFQIYTEECRSDLMEKWAKAVHFVPYVHPHNSAISMESSLIQLRPHLGKLLARIKTQDVRSAQDVFCMLSDVFTQKKNIPDELLRHRMQHLQNLKSSYKKDPKLSEIDLALFGFHSCSDWFGQKFIEIASQYILNGSAFAKMNGYRISKNEAREDLISNLIVALKSSSIDVKNSYEINNAYYHYIQNLEMEESSVVEIWQDVLQFRKLLKNADKIVSQDPALLQEEKKLARQICKFDVYELPDVLQLSDFTSLLKLQHYIDLVSYPRNKTEMLVPLKQHLPILDIEKRAPELVQKKYVLNFCQVNKNELLADISLKDIWDWQLRDDNYDLLVRNFTFLAKKQTRDERFIALEGLSSIQRSEVDMFAQNKIFEASPDRLKQALLSANRMTREVRLSLKGSTSPFAIDNLSQLMSYLDKAPLSSEKTSNIDAILAQQKLNSYSEDGEHFYSISVLGRDDSKRLLTFSEADSMGIMHTLLLRKLEESYPQVRKKDPAAYINADGTFKPVDLVADSIGKFVYSDLLKAIEQTYTAYFGKAHDASEVKDVNFYVSYRPLLYLQEARKALETDPSDPNWVIDESSKKFQRDYVKQWLMKRSIKTVSKRTAVDIFDEDIFSYKEGQLSSFIRGKQGAFVILKMNEKQLASALLDKDESEINKLLFLDAQKELFDLLLSKIEDKQCIVSMPKLSGSL